LTLAPIDGLAINIGLPFIEMAGAFGDDILDPITPTLGDAWKNFFIQLAYTIDGIGTAAISYEGGTMDFVMDGYEPDWDTVSPASIYASFNVTALEDMGMGLNIGLRYILPMTEDVNAQATTINGPFMMGLAFSYDGGDFGVNARAAAAFAGSFKVYGDSSTDLPSAVVFDILPWYDLGFMKFHFGAGISFTGEVKVGNYVWQESAFGWHINPYISTTVGAGQFFAGFRVGSTGIQGEGNNWNAAADAKDTRVTFSVPIGMIFSF